MLTKYAKIAAATLFTVSASAILHAQIVTRTISLPGLPEQIAADPITDLVFVAVPNFGAKPYDYLTIVNGKTDTVVASYRIPEVAYAVAVDPVRSIVYVGGTYTDVNGVVRSEVVAFSECDRVITKVVPVTTTAGDGIQGLAVNYTTGDLFVANGSDNEVDVIWTKSLTVNQRISVSGEPFGVSTNSSLDTAYISLLNGSVATIKGRSYAVSTTEISPNAAYAGIATNLSTGTVYTSNSDGGPASTVAQLNSNGAFVGNIGVGNTPIGIDVDAGKFELFVANTQDNTVDVINTRTGALISRLPVSGLFLAVDSTTHKVYVGANNGSPTLSVITE